MGELPSLWDGKREGKELRRLPGFPKKWRSHFSGVPAMVLFPFSPRKAIEMVSSRLPCRRVSGGKGCTNVILKNKNGGISP